MELRAETEKYLFYCQFQKGLNHKTINAYRIDLEQFIEFVEENKKEITKEVLNLYLVFLHQRYKQKSVKRKIASVKALFNYLVDEQVLEWNPFQRIRTKFKEEQVLPKIIPRDVIEQLLTYLYRMEASGDAPAWNRKLILRDIAVIEMLFSTGLRISELCGLQDSAFDTKNGVLRIYGKGAKERYLQIGNDEVLAELRKYREMYENDIRKHGYFFVNRYGKPLSEQSARRMLHKHTEALSLETNITPHMFRHSFATFLLEEDVDIRYIQKMLGHSSITTTQIYTYVTTEKEREILKRRHPRNKMRVEISNFEDKNGEKNK